MNWLLITLLLVVTLWLIGMGLMRRGGIYEVPFLVGAMFLGFILPQLPALAADPLQPPFAVERMLFFSSLCAALTGLGWVAGLRPLKHALQWTIDERGLLGLAAALSLGGAFFYFQVSRLPPELRLATMPSGILVMYFFLARMLTFGFAMAMLCLVRRPSNLAWGIVLFDAALLVDRLVTGGRRGEFTEFLLAVLLAAWFYRGWTAPRPLALAAVVLAAVSINSAADYRTIVRQEETLDWSRISDINVVGNFLAVLDQGGPETRNAVERMEIIDRTRAFDYGFFHWNVIVFNFIPAQLVGAEFKESLRVSTDAQRAINYNPDLGSTETGMADAFASFWYLGALKFFLIAYVLARLYCSARQGWVIPQLLYIFGITSAMLSVSHHTQWLLSNWLQFAVLALPGLPLLRRPDQASSTQSGRSPLPSSQR